MEEKNYTADENYMREALKEALRAQEKNEDAYRSYRACGNAGDHYGGGLFRREVFIFVYLIRNGRTVSHVCRRAQLGADRPGRLWGSRP